MILITGATGQYGSQVIKHLIQKGVNVADIGAMVRSEEKAQKLKTEGVRIHLGNYEDVDSMRQAFAGVDKLMLVSSNDRGPVTNRTKHHMNAITAAKEAGVKHIFYTSFVRTPNHAQSAIADFQNSHIETEDFLKESGMQYTILQNGIYQEMILPFIGEKVAETGRILFPAHDGEASWVLREELAEVAAQILISEGHENKTYTLTNTDSIGFEQIAGYISACLGKDISFQSPPADEFQSMMKQGGVPEMYVGMMTMWGTAVAQNTMNKTDPALADFLGRKPTSVKQFIDQIFKGDNRL
ncbi:MAG: SDR family oxidoreductase [Bacteroidota bacterium]